MEHFLISVAIGAAFLAAHAGAGYFAKGTIGGAIVFGLGAFGGSWLVQMF